MTGIKVVVLGSLFSALGLAQTGLIEAGQNVGALSTAALMGLVIVALAVVIKTLYGRLIAREEKYELVVNAIAKITQESTDTSKAVVTMLVETKDTHNRLAAAMETLVAHCGATLKR